LNFIFLFYLSKKKLMTVKIIIIFLKRHQLIEIITKYIINGLIFDKIVSIVRGVKENRCKHLI
jgi:hypothetical protein